MADGMVDGIDLVMREWAKGHELVCEERMTHIRDDVGMVRTDIKDVKNNMTGEIQGLKDTISTFSKMAIGVMVAMLGWLAIQVYDRVANPVEHTRPSIIKELKQ